MRDFESVSNAKVYHWDPMSFEDLPEGQKTCYGKAVVPRWRFDKARVIVAVDCDFLGVHVTPTANARSFSDGRRRGAEMSRLVVFESLLSLTGTNADERHRIPAESAVNVLGGLLHELVVNLKASHYSQDGGVLKDSSALRDDGSGPSSPRRNFEKSGRRTVEIQGC